MMHEANGKIGDYHSSSSAAFDEGNLESISRFYNIGIIKIPFSKTSSCYYYILHPNLYWSKKCPFRDTKMPVYKDSRICKYKNA